jgi:hypothetical protein
MSTHTPAHQDVLIELKHQFNLSHAQAENVLEWLTENDDLDDAVEEILYSHYMDLGEMPYGVAKARSGDPQEWIGGQLARQFRDQL